MSEDQTNSLQSDDAEKADPSYPDADWLLQALVGLAENGLEFAVTLNVGGFLVSGLVAGGNSYFKRVGAEFANVLPEDAQGTAAEFFAPMVELYDNPEKDPAAPPRALIHLKNASFFNTHGAPLPNNRSVWWRGKLSAVDGFKTGELGAADAD